MRKEFFTIKDLWAYILDKNLRAEKREKNIVYLHNNTTKEYIEAVTVKF